MSNRKLTIAAMQHEARGLTARLGRRKRPAMSTPRVYDHRRRKRDRQGRCIPAPTPVSSAGRHRGLRGLAYKRETGITIARSGLLPVDIPLRGASVGALASDRR